MTDRKPYRHRFQLSIIQYALWLYHRFCLSQRDVQELLHERGIQISLVYIHLIGERLQRRSKSNLEHDRALITVLLAKSICHGCMVDKLRAGLVISMMG